MIPNILYGALLAVVIIGTAGVAYFFFGGSGDVVENPGGEILSEVPGGSETLPSITLAEKVVRLADGSEATIRLPREFDITVAAEDLGKARFMAMSSDGRLFLPDMVNYNLSHEGKLFVLGDFDETTHTFKTKHTYLSGLRTPNSVAFYTDEDGQEWLYLALTEHLLRYKYTPGDVKPSSKPEVVVNFPNKQSPGEVSVVWHITRTIVFHDDRVYIAVGSGCNSCEQLEGGNRGMVYSVKPDGTDFKVHADGLRNAVGLAFLDDTLYATANGVDHLGEDIPNEAMYRLEEGKHYGWPFCMVVDGEVVDAPGNWTKPFSCEDTPKPFAYFEPHSAPLGITYFENAHPLLNNSFLVALHGSFDVKIGTGNKIMRVDDNGKQDVFMDGFLTKDGERIVRAVHFLQRDRNSFFFTDDQAGRVYYVYAKE